MKDFTREGGCLGFRWLGPYEITTSLGKGIYRLKEHNGEKVCFLSGIVLFVACSYVS